jgi:hypothetical protein
MASKKTTTTRSTPTKAKKPKKLAAPPRKDAATVPVPEEQLPVGQAPPEQSLELAAMEQATTPESARAESKPTRKAKKTKSDRQGKKLSALDAAAQVLAETGQAMTCQALIATMVQKGYWTSPHGKTPQATLYAAITREITTKGKAARFQKVDRGQFALARAEG